MASEILVYAEVPLFVGPGERRAVYRDRHAEVIQAVLVRLEAQAYIPHRLASRKLAEKQVQELVVAREVPRMVITEVSCNALVELVSWYEVCHLRENVSSRVHILTVLGCKDTHSFQIAKC